MTCGRRLVVGPGSIFHGVEPEYGGVGAGIWTLAGRDMVARKRPYGRTRAVAEEGMSKSAK